MIGRDVVHGLRRLRRAPGFTSVAVLVIGFGIGVVTAVFSVVHARFLAPLPVHEPERLVYLYAGCNRMSIIDELHATRDETLRCFTLPERQLSRRYAADKWDVRHILHHLADAETVMFDRIRRVLSEPRQVLWAFDQDAWAGGLNYAELPLELSRNVFEAVRNAVIHYAERHYVRDGHREFVHSETGVRTLKDEFDKVAAHTAHHLAQIRSALGQS